MHRNNNTCYRPPGSKVKPAKKHVASVFNQVKRENKKMYFVGDSIHVFFL